MEAYASFQSRMDGLYFRLLHKIGTFQDKFNTFQANSDFSKEFFTIIKSVSITTKTSNHRESEDKTDEENIT